MARRRRGRDAQKQPRSRKKRSFGIRACDEWKTWLQNLATFRRKEEMTDVVDEALEDYSAKHNFTKPPKR